MKFIDALLPNVAMAFEKQLFMSDVIGPDHQFMVDISAGRIDFGNDLVFAVQLVGTESDVSKTWLWAWANDASQLPASVLMGVEQLRDYGSEQDIAALTRAELPIDSYHNGHYFSLFASAYLLADAYYRVPYESGALFLLVDDDRFPQDDRDPMQRITTTFPQVISALNLPSHRAAFLGYLKAHGITTDTDSAREIRAHSSNGQTLTASFDDRGRLADLNASLHQ